MARARTEGREKAGESNDLKQRRREGEMERGMYGRKATIENGELAIEKREAEKRRC